ncbi:hypothetical protein HRR78_002834 [Exophiala dermatitidis]|nr:hypothetical protein HRR75_004754 [Exophiala dermatitidis]KAJ4554430.1 hypothetical protein HRR78_002834 [Exophiala dermatitidis]
MTDNITSGDDRWMSELISNNAEQRAFTAAAMNTLQYTFSAWIPLVWFQQIHQPNVTPGNRAAAVMAGFNVLVFSTIAVLAHREKMKKKRQGQLQPLEETASTSFESPDISIVDHTEKKVSTSVRQVAI